MVDPINLTPPDDTGSDTFGRFCYQAYVAFRYCLACAFDEEVVSVIPEHFEDIAVEYPNRWVFLQIKTRNLERGPWRLADLLAADGGALHSLYRTHRELAKTSIDYLVVACLEGAINPKDDINCLLTPEGREDNGLRQRICDRLKMPLNECDEFLARVRLRPGEPSRDLIVERNLRLLGAHSPTTQYGKLNLIHDSVVRRIFTAMESRVSGDEWPLAAFDVDQVSEAARNNVRQKRLNADLLRPLFGELTAPNRPLLQRIADPIGRVPSVIEEKLLAAGATPQIVSDAETLRANANAWWYQSAAATLQDNHAVMDDLRLRLQMRFNSVIARHVGLPAPANQVWGDLFDLLNRQAGTIDSSDSFLQDPDLLLGEICSMTDECLLEWGQSGA